MGVSRGVTHEYAHPDTKLTAKSRDIDTSVRAVNSLAENLSFDPAQGPGDLVSLSAGLTGRQGCVTPKQQRSSENAFYRSWMTSRILPPYLSDQRW